MYEVKEPYIIAETAYNHEGDIDYLYRMIDEIASLDLSAVKLHLLLNPESYMHREHPLFSQVVSWIFSQAQWGEIIGYSKKKGLDIVALCDDVESIEYIVGNNKAVTSVELHASGLNDHFLLESVSKFKGRVILGISGSTLDEIEYAVNFLIDKGRDNILLMHGFQSYPTNYSDINLSRVIRIREQFNLPMGYADHTAFDDPCNEIISVMGAMMGINVLEKHYTLDYGKERIDYHSAVSKKQMLRIKQLMKLALAVYGDGELKMSGAELEYGKTGPMKKALVARKKIKKGEQLSLENLWFKRTAEKSTVKQNLFWQLIGLEAVKDIEEDEIIDFTKVEHKFKKPDLKV